MTTQTDVEIVKGWAEENLSEGDKNALTELALDDTSGEVLSDKTVHKIFAEVGQTAAKQALEVAQQETVDRMNEHWTANSDKHSR